MTRSDLVLAVVGLAAGMYCIHGMVTETGVVGWVNYAQQALFGSYSLKLTMLVVICGLMVFGVGLWNLAMRFSGGDDDGAMERLMLGPSAGEPQRPLSGRAIWAVALGMIAATWVIGFAAHAWLAATQREDASARYEPITVADGAPAPQPAGKHVSLQGRLLGDKVLTQRKGSGSAGRDEYHLVPVAAPHWKAGDEVSYVVKVRSLQELPGQKARFLYRRPNQPAPPPDALLGALDGEVPVPAAQEFRKMGVVLASGSHLVRVVPSKGDRPDVKDSSAEDFQAMLIICAGISGVLLLSFAAVHWGAVRYRRKLEAGGYRVPA